MDRRKQTAEGKERKPSATNKRQQRSENAAATETERRKP
jgi:hypothetical protein